jgi:outer membrane biosynthesis protein TonB
VSVRGAYGKSWAKLSMPAAKRCLSSSVDLEDDEDFSMASSEGLNSSQIMGAVRGHNAQTMRCASADKPLSGKVVLEFAVGCDGRVMDIEVTENTTFDNDFGECVAKVMKYTPFPAHDQPDGAIFSIPLLYE